MLGIALAGYLYAGYFLKNKEQALRGQIEALTKQQQQESLYFRLEKLAVDSKERREALRAPLLDQESKSIEVLTWIESLAPQNGITLETKNLQKVTDKETKTDWIEVSFVFSGTEERVERFIAILEHIPYLSYVTSLSMAAQSGGNWEATATLRILLFKTP